MNFYFKYTLISLVSLTLISALHSCKKSTNNDKYFYNAGRDTIAPKIVTSVPALNAVFALGADIHMVGVVTDLESKDKGGKLKSLTLNLSQVDAVDHAVIKTFMNRTPAVDGKEGYTFNEKWAVVNGTPPMFCRFLATAVDYAGRVTKDSVFLTIQ